jgi:TonB family protein
MVFGLMLALAGCKGCDGCGGSSRPAGASGSVGSDGGTSATASSSPSPSSSKPMIETSPGVDEALRSIRPELNACYRANLKKNPTATGRIVFKVVITPDGKVKDVALENSTADIELVACARMAVSHATFAPTANHQDTTLGIPIDFHPPANPAASAEAP